MRRSKAPSNRRKLLHKSAVGLSSSSSSSSSSVKTIAAAANIVKAANSENKRNVESSNLAPSEAGKQLSPKEKSIMTSTPPAKQPALKRRRMGPPPAAKKGKKGFSAPKIDAKVLKQRMEEETASQEDSKLFSVMWCKASNKKHKTYNDAFLFLQGAKHLLKDAEGKELYNKGNVIGKMPRTKPGDLIYLGGKEVEIMNELDTQLYFSGQLFVKGGMKGVGSTGPAKGIQMSKPKRTEFKKHSSGAATPQPKTKPKPLHSSTDENALVLNAGHAKSNARGQLLTEVVVDPYLATKLRPHQREGVRFLYECVMGNKSSDFHGAILADEMGLGKTIQAITLVWTLLKQGPTGKPAIKKAVIVTPASLVGNWQREFQKWLGVERLRPLVIKGGAGSSAAQAAESIKEFPKATRYPVMIISYEMFRSCSVTISSLPCCGLVICDEGHRLKNGSSQIAVALNNLKTRRRVILSGTPIQNQMDEFHAMINFVNPDMLGDRNTFMRVFGTPIMKGRSADVGPKERVLAEARSTELTRMTSQCILRRTAKINEKYLPEKVELVVMCKPTSVQERAYKAVLRSGQSIVYEAVKNGSMHSALGVIISLRKVCNAPVLAYDKVLEGATREHERSIYTDAQETYGVDYEALNNTLKQMSEHGGSSGGRGKSGNSSQGNDTDKLIVPLDTGKLVVLHSLLNKIASSTKDRVVLISNFTRTLDVLQGVCDLVGLKTVRLDGSTDSSKRTEMVKSFNNGYAGVRVFLLSARAGGVGLNLIGANRLILFDPDWNPATDQQAMARVWRDGQKKKVSIYRLVTTGTIEEKIYQRQVLKTGLSTAVVDDKANVERNFTNDDLKDLFTLKTDTVSDTYDLMQKELKKKERRRQQLAAQGESEQEDEEEGDAAAQEEEVAGDFTQLKGTQNIDELPSMCLLGSMHDEAKALISFALVRRVKGADANDDGEEEQTSDCGGKEVEDDEEEGFEGDEDEVADSAEEDDEEDEEDGCTVTTVIADPTDEDVLDQAMEMEV